MNDPPHRWNPETRPETPAPAPLGRPPLVVGDTEARPTDPVGGAVQSPKGPPPRLMTPIQAEVLELHAILGAGSAFSGTLSFAGHARIDGELEGAVHGGELLVIGHGALVRGRIEASQVIVLGGRVEADIVAARAIELYVPAIVTGELRCPQIYIERGVQFQGTCDMTGPPPPVERPSTRDEPFGAGG